MKNIDIIVMGKTGAGKSTLINAVLEEDLAPTGSGHAVTRENRVYTRRMLLPLGGDGNGGYGLQGCQLNMYDTVGLEIDSSITQKTLQEIRKHIEDTKAKMSSDDMHLVWFCVNDCGSRFESYETDLIRQLSIEYEIPFIIVLTQCFSEEQGELSAMIRETFPEILLKRVLAKDYETRAGVIPAHGVSDLIKTSATEYRHLKADILIKKLKVLNESMKEEKENKKKSEKIENKGNKEIEKYVAKAVKAGTIPVMGIPAVYRICIRMIKALNDLAGLKADQVFTAEIFEDVVFGLVMAPFMVLPGLSALSAGAYVAAVGEAYLKALLSVIDGASDKELENNALIRERLKEELEKIKNQEEERW